MNLGQQESSRVAGEERASCRKPISKDLIVIFKTATIREN